MFAHSAIARRVRFNLIPEGVVPADSVSLSEQLSLRNLDTDLLTILAYVMVTRFSINEEHGLSFHIGPVPLFVTDAALAMLVVLTFFARPGQLARYLLTGDGARLPGKAVWILCGLAIVYFLMAFPSYRILAARDLAIFGYSIFFPLTYFAIDSRSKALKIVRYFAYATLLLAVLLLAQEFAGLKLGLFNETRKAFEAGGRFTLKHPDAGDLAANIAVSMVAVATYALFERRLRWLHTFAALIYLMALAVMLDRSAVLAVALAGLVSFLAVRGRDRFRLASLGVLILAGALAIGGITAITGRSGISGRLFSGLASAGGLGSDPDFQFRLERWRYALLLWETQPILGSGFGVQMAPTDVIGTGTKQGMFNRDAPHNSYLTVLVRTGLVGFLLISFSLAYSVYRLILSSRQPSEEPDNLALLNMLVVMSVFAGFNLFFERPTMCGPFWIALALAWRLAETSRYRRGYLVAR